MPRVTNKQLFQHRITGFQRKANGEPDQTPFEVKPLSYQQLGSNLITGASFTVTPDERGYFEFSLVPGRYECQFLAHALTFTVPSDDQDHELTSLLT